MKKIRTSKLQDMWGKESDFEQLFVVNRRAVILSFHRDPSVMQQWILSFLTDLQMKSKSL